MKLAWLTDSHLNFIEQDARLQFYDTLVDTACDAVLMTGDIGDASSLPSLLGEMAARIKKPIYFVLGNHDYYRSQISAVREDIAALVHSSPCLSYLSISAPQKLTENTVLLGQDGWADGRYGDYVNSRVVLNDSRKIVDLFHAQIQGQGALLKKMQQLSDTDAQQLQVDIDRSIEQYHPKKIIILTHVPPFKEACFYEDQPSNDDFLPYFASKATGDVLLAAAKAHAAVEFLVLCGHTHARAEYRALDNLMVKVGHAEYGRLEMQEVVCV
jgi:predicted MPP superfamily phosphohydrolase